MLTTRLRSASALALVALCLASAASTLAQSSAPAAAPSTAPASSAPVNNAPAASATASSKPSATNSKPAPTATKPANAAKKGTAPPSKNVDANSRVVTKQSITIIASLTPEEKEDDELNHHSAYAFGSVTDTNCQTVIDTYKNDLIPIAEQAKFPKNRAKYLEIAHDATGKCQMTQGRYIEAEQSFRDALVQAEIWPGKDNFAYADLWIGLSAVQLKQEHWQEAEASAAESAAIHQGRIDDYNKVLSTVTGEAADNMRKALQREQRWRSVSLSYVAVTKAREGNLDQAAKIIEQAYQEAVAGATPPEQLRNFEEFGAHIAELTDNAGDAAKWAIRADTSSQPRPASSSNK
jgi:tetratricopeptide (TPR) repeat protein